MSSDDPFADDDSDRTVLRPMPGGRRTTTELKNDDFPSAAPRPSQPAPPLPEVATNQPPDQSASRVEFAAEQIIGAGMNLLVERASNLLLLGSRLRNSISQDQVPQLREQMIQQIKNFEDKARSGGCDQDAVLTSRYLLCTYLDEAVMSTPWGSESGWSNQSLLSTFHNENWGGEKFFQIMDQHLQMPSRSLDILEFIFVCLAFGFQGKYQLSERGGNELTSIQDRLFREITSQRGDFERELSPHWRGVPDKRYALARYIPLWVVAAVLGVFLFLIFSVFWFIVDSNTAPIEEEIERIIQQQTAETSQ